MEDMRISLKQKQKLVLFNPLCVCGVCVCAHIAENDYYVQKRLNTTLVRGYLKLVHIRTKK